MKSEQQSIKDYFENDYLEDMLVYRNYFYNTFNVKEDEIATVKNKDRPSICRHHVWEIKKEKLFDNYKNFRYFLICNYELNLIIQVVYTHYNDKWEQFKTILPDFIYLDPIGGLGCSITEPWSLLSTFRDVPGLGIRPKDTEILQADLMFRDLLENIFYKYPELNINWDSFSQAMLNDKDIRNRLESLSRIK